MTLFFGLFSIGASAQSTQSDYEIQKSFKTQYAEYEQKVEQLSSADSAQALITSIREFDQKYNKHADLLDKALYPDTYEQRIEKLKESSVVAKNRLETMKQQTKKMEKLETQLTSYENDLQQLNKRTDSLQNAMQESIQSEKKLSAMVREYRQSLEKRDELILAFIDSMVIAYQEMDLQKLDDLENIDQKSRLESDGDALKMIHNISVENLDILQRNDQNLRLQDYMRMADVQQQFEKMWSRLGDKITEVYDGKNAKEMASEVDQKINKWNQMLKEQTLASLKDTLAEKNIAVSGFETSDQFYSSLKTYLDNKIQKSKDNASKAGYNDFTNFKSFWNEIEVQWANNFVDAGLLSQPQMATLNAKVDSWAEHAQPRSNNLLVYLLGASVLLAVALGVMLFREKKSKRNA